MHSEHVPPFTSESLGKIQILLIPGEAMEQNSRWMRSDSSRNVEDPEQIAAVAWNEWMLHTWWRRGYCSPSLRGQLTTAKKRQREYKIAHAFFPSNQ